MKYSILFYLSFIEELWKIMSKINTFSQNPDKEGYFGKYGGRYIAETLMPLVLELEKSYEEAKKDKKFLSFLASS